MDTQNNNGQTNPQPMNQTPTQPMGSSPMQSTVTSTPSTFGSASFLSRMFALLIDVVLITFVSGLLSTPFMMLAGSDNAAASATGSMMSNLLSMVIQFGYFVGMTTYKGATLGKMALGLRVQNESTGQNLTVVEAILREVVGKFLSSIVLGLGYFWMLWDPKKQCWHDKLAKSVVVKSK